MTDLRPIEDSQSSAEERLVNAWEYLGARPGPGTDLAVTRLSVRSWKVEGLTPCGRAFLLKLYGGDRYGAESQAKLSGFIRKAAEWGLTTETNWAEQPKVTRL